MVFASYLLTDLRDGFLNRARASCNWNVIIRGFVHRVRVLMWDKLLKGGRSTRRLSGDPEEYFNHRPSSVLQPKLD